MFFYNIDYDKVERDVLSIYRRNGFIGFNIIGENTSADVDYLSELLKIDIPSIIMVFVYAFSEERVTDILCHKKLSYLGLNQMCLGGGVRFSSHAMLHQFLQRIYTDSIHIELLLSL